MRLKIMLAPGASIDGLTIEQDGTAFSIASAGTALPVDPGSHRIVASAPGHETWETTIQTAGEGETTDVMIPPLKKKPVAVAAPPTTVEPAMTPSNDPDRADQGISGMEIAGYVLLGVGGAALIGGAILGGIVLGEASDIEEQCNRPPGNACPTPELVDQNDSAQAKAGASTGLVIAGGALVVAGLIVVLVSPDGSTELADNIFVTPHGVRLQW